MSIVKKPNHLLRYEREKRGLSQRKVADLLDTSEEMVSRWERGERKTSPFYQEKLCQLFGKDAIALGFLDSPAFPAPDEAPQAVQEVGISENITILPSTVRTPTHALDLLLTSPGIPVEQQAGAWLTLGANSLGPLFDEGWTVENVLHALEVVLQGVQAMPAISRRHLIQLGVAAVASSIPIPTRQHISTEDRIKLHQALSESIVSGWKLFHTAGNAQVLAVGQAQLFLVQQNHAWLYPKARALCYTGAYSQIGMALHFQQRDEEALQAYRSSYIAALDAGEPWYVAQSLICQADSHHALGQYSTAIQTIEEALRILGSSTDELVTRARAHLLSCWADNAMMLRDYGMAQKKLDEAEAYLDRIEPDEEFDQASWLLLEGKYALQIGDYAKAKESFQMALKLLPDQWVLRRTMTAIGLAMALARMRERQESIAIAEKLIPMVETVDAEMINRWFHGYLQQDLLGAFPQDDQVRTFVLNTHKRLPRLATS